MGKDPRARHSGDDPEHESNYLDDHAVDNDDDDNNDNGDEDYDTVGDSDDAHVVEYNVHNDDVDDTFVIRITFKAILSMATNIVAFCMALLQPQRGRERGPALSADLEHAPE